MGKVALVTGGSRGIGAACAVALARDGWDVCLTYLTQAEAAESVVSACKGSGRRTTALRCDVSDPEQVARAFGRADEMGTLGALVNNAGILRPTSRVDEMDAERIRRVMDVNVVGSFLCAREAVLRMSTAHGGAGGAIVNLSSAASRLGGPGELVDYAASKGAIDTMTVGLAKEVAPEGIRVNAVRPGLIETGIHASAGQPDRAQRLSSTVPMLRTGSPEEVAEAVAWLCSDAASYITGALLDVSGGR